MIAFLMMHMVPSMVLASSGLASPRETVNFDFAWRFELDYIPSPSPVAP